MILYNWLLVPELWWGIIGGFCATILKWRENATIPKCERTPFPKSEWLFNPLLGAVLASAYGSSGTHLNAITALTIGGGAPLILRSLFAAAPQRVPGTKEAVSKAPEPPQDRGTGQAAGK